MRTLSIALLVVLAGMVSSTQASQRHCQHCGSQQNCRKVCRLICGKKKDSKPVYSCECEDFCVPGASVQCGETWVCTRLGTKCRKPVYKPVCASVHSKIVLVKKKSEKEVPDYKWVVDEVCCRCGERIDGTQQPAVAPKPATALFGGRIKAEEVVVETPADFDRAEIERVSTETSDAALPVGRDAQLAFATDEVAEPASKSEPKAEPEAKRRGWLQRLFGK